MKKILLGFGLLVGLSANSMAIGKVVWDPTHTLETIRVQMNQIEAYSKQLEQLKMEAAQLQKLPDTLLTYSKQGKELMAILSQIAQIEAAAKNTLINVNNFEKGWDQVFPDGSKLNDAWQSKVKQMWSEATNVNKVAMQQNKVSFDKQASTTQDLQALLNQTKTSVGMQQSVQTTNTILVKVGTLLNSIQASINVENMAQRWEKQQEIEEKKQVQAEIEKAAANAKATAAAAQKRVDEYNKKHK